MRPCDGTTRLGEIGHIQSCGYILAFEEGYTRYPSGMRVLCSSDNIMEAPWIDRAISRIEILGGDLGDVLPKTFMDTVRSLTKRQKKYRKPRTDYIAPKANRNTADIYPAAPSRAEVELEVEGKKDIVSLALVVANPGVYILELELKHGPHSTGAEQTPGMLQVADLLADMPVGSNPQLSTAALCDAVAGKMPAYDRVMVYRFDVDDGSGEVIHESIQPSSQVESSYQGFHFPGADIPPSARELFKLVGVRFIADTTAASVPISTLNERVATLSLSGSALRAPAECHLGYLRNMGVRASMVVAIIVDDALWGLLIFHSYAAPVHPSCEERVMVEMAATITASLISRHQREEIATTAFALSHVLVDLPNDRVQDFLSAKHEELLRVLDVDAIVLCTQLRVVSVYGNNDLSLTPSECEDLVDGEQSDRRLLFKSLGAKGVAFFAVRSCLVAFLRGSVASHVKWAGKPDPPQVDRHAISPSSSFERFTEVAAAKFKPWSPATVDLLEMVRQAFSTQLYAQFLPDDLHETFVHVSHELRTPFHGVMGAIEILEAGTDTMTPAEQRDLLGLAARCGTSMMGILDDILDIAKDRNNTEALQERFTASTPVLQTMAAMSPFAATNAIDLIADAGPAESTLKVVGDCRRIKVVVQNIVNNAIKFTPGGGKVRVFHVVLDSLEDANDWWAKEAGRFDAQRWIGSPKASSDSVDKGSFQTMKWHVYCVEDSGAGIPSSELPHLVAAYGQVSHGASKSHAGTGLGLHICKTNVDIMGGALGIASTTAEHGKGGGTLVTVIVPLCLAVGTDAYEIDAEDCEKNVPDCGDTGSRKIAFLVVDDQHVNVKLLEHKITRYFNGRGNDVQVVKASDGFSALETHLALRSPGHEDPVLAGVFMDFHMPELDGIECTRRIRSLEQEHNWPRLTICGCTADLTDGSREHFKDAGGDNVLCKPWRPDDVGRACSAMVAEVLDAKHHGARGA